jgi:hypothetical protein
VSADLASKIQSLRDELTLIDEQLQAYSTSGLADAPLISHGEQVLYEFLKHRRAKILVELTKLVSGCP